MLKQVVRHTHNDIPPPLPAPRPNTCVMGYANDWHEEC